MPAKEKGRIDQAVAGGTRVSSCSATDAAAASAAVAVAEAAEAAVPDF